MNETDHGDRPGRPGEPADPLGHRRAAGADDHAEVGKHSADTFQIGAALLTDDLRVDQERVQLHRHQLLGRDRAAQHPLLPAGRFGALGENGDEAAVVVDYREPGLLRIHIGGSAGHGWPDRRGA